LENFELLDCNILWTEGVSIFSKITKMNQVDGSSRTHKKKALIQEFVSNKGRTQINPVKARSNTLGRFA
jgi:hypothetical protein